MISLCSYSMLTPIFFLLLYVWGGGKKAQSVGLPLHSICSYRLNNTCMTRCLVNRTGHQQATQTFGLYRGSNGTTLLSFWCLNVDSCLEFKLSELDSCTRSLLNSYNRPHFLDIWQHGLFAARRNVIKWHGYSLLVEKRAPEAKWRSWSGRCASLSGKSPRAVSVFYGLLSLLIRQWLKWVTGGTTDGFMSRNHNLTDWLIVCPQA